MRHSRLAWQVGWSGRGRCAGDQCEAPQLRRALSYELHHAKVGTGESNAAIAQGQTAGLAVAAGVARASRV